MKRSVEDGATGEAAPSPVYSRQTPWSLASLSLAFASLLALFAWFQSWTLPAGPAIFASGLLRLSTFLAVIGLLTVASAFRRREGAGSVVSAVACIVVGLPGLFLLWLYAVFTYQ